MHCGFDFSYFQNLAGWFVGDRRWCVGKNVREERWCACRVMHLIIPASLKHTSPQFEEGCKVAAKFNTLDGFCSVTMTTTSTQDRKYSVCVHLISSLQWTDERGQFLSIHFHGDRPEGSVLLHIQTEAEQRSVERRDLITGQSQLEGEETGTGHAPGEIHNPRVYRRSQLWTWAFSVFIFPRGTYDDNCLRKKIVNYSANWMKMTSLQSQQIKIELIKVC